MNNTASHSPELAAGNSINITLFHWSAQSGGKNWIKWYYETKAYLAVVKRVTDKAILIAVEAKGDLWLPKSKISVQPNTDSNFSVCSNFCKYAQMRDGFPNWKK
jgi:hypothetical protein